MNKKGFISAIFLWYFVLILTLIGYIESQFQSRIQVYLNMKEANCMMDIEVKIIDWLRCEIKNNRFLDGDYIVDGISFQAIKNLNRIEIYLHHNTLTYLEYSLNMFEAEVQCEVEIANNEQQSYHNDEV
ncbi:hypothetical protein [Anaerorhabdus furcosa]|uniref:Uncharacterized protein n=1 Tax=Anaerorhabdus furcosa TaxID=118967 RepID=A0A1T4P835_9FIRM|nr:hypothetical protein [Anaerorhabdus furcosa]SJZ87609.1 hypothetical protein SAMN02745191_1923 [Anaerorhabdus furcosa]